MSTTAAAQRLSFFDASVFASERRGANMSVGAVFICAATTPTEADLSALVESRGLGEFGLLAENPTEAARRGQGALEQC